MAGRGFFLGNRAWWFGALLIGPTIGALAGDAVIGVVATSLLILPVFVIFDTDRPWWSDEVRHLPDDSTRSRVEVRKLTISAAAGLLAGIALAILKPWA